MIVHLLAKLKLVKSPGIRICEVLKATQNV